MTMAVKADGRARWTPERDQRVRDLRSAGASWDQIGSELGRDGTSCRQRLVITLDERDPHPDAVARYASAIKTDPSVERRSPELRTRDGHISFAGMQVLQEIERELAGAISVSPIEAMRWAVENKIPLNGPKRLFQINAWRRERGMAIFKIVNGAPESAPEIRTVQTTKVEVRRQNAAPPQLLSEDSDIRPVPIVETQEGLIDLVTGHVGTLTGLVTPDIARWLLELNTDNRPLSDSAVRRFREILQQGRWINTGEPVIVSTEGVLNDGQHRLTAIVRTRIGAVVDVRFGIERQAFKVTGTGTRRTAGNVLAMGGHKMATAQAGIARLLAIHDLGLMAQHNVRVDTDVILQTTTENPLIERVATLIKGAKFAPARSGPFAMVMVLAARNAPWDKVAEFAAIAAGGLCEREEIAPRRLHVRLRDEALSRNRISQLDVAILTAKAWNAWAEGRDVNILKINDADRASATFPRVVPMKA